MARPNKLFNTDITVSGVVTTVSGVFDNITVGGLPFSANTATGFRGALLSVSSGTSIPSASSVVIGFDTVAYDTDGFWDIPSARFVIPSGINRIRLSGQMAFNSAATGDRRFIIRKNESGAFGDPEAGQVLFTKDVSTTLSSSQTHIIPGISPIMRVIAGDIFTIVGRQDSGGSLDVTSAATYIQLEVLEPVPGVPATLSTISGTFAESLTVSGIPVATGTSLFRGALLTTSSGSSIATGGGLKTIPFDTAEYDTIGYLVPGRGDAMVIPPGVSYARFSSSASWQTNTTGRRQTQIYINNTAFPGVVADNRDAVQGGGTHYSNPITGIVPVSPGDVIELRAFQDSGITLTINSNVATWFQIEVLE
jgi:hypothetical protein